MIFADNSPNQADCPECSGTASDKERPESGWFVCGCGEEFEFATTGRNRNELPKRIESATHVVAWRLAVTNPASGESAVIGSRN